MTNPVLNTMEMIAYLFDVQVIMQCFTTPVQASLHTQLQSLFHTHVPNAKWDTIIYRNGSKLTLNRLSH